MPGFLKVCLLQDMELLVKPVIEWERLRNQELTLWTLPLLQIYGYRAPETPIGWNITPLRQQLISSLMTLGAFISSGAAGFAAARLGRRHCLWLASLVCCVSNIIMMATTHIGALYTGRLLIGLANGYFMTFSQLYIQETSPAKYRGLFLSAFQFCTSFVRYCPQYNPIHSIPSSSRATTLSSRQLPFTNKSTVYADTYWGV